MKRFTANLLDDTKYAAKVALLVSFIFTLIELPLVWVYLLTRYLAAFVGGLLGLLSVRAIVWLWQAAYRAITNRKVIK